MKHQHHWTVSGNCLECGARQWTRTQVALAVAAGLAIPLVAIFCAWCLGQFVPDFLHALGAASK